MRVWLKVPKNPGNHRPCGNSGYLLNGRENCKRLINWLLIFIFLVF